MIQALFHDYVDRMDVALSSLGILRPDPGHDSQLQEFLGCLLESAYFCCYDGALILQVPAQVKLGAIEPRDSRMGVQVQVQPPSSTLFRRAQPRLVKPRVYDKLGSPPPYRSLRPSSARYVRPRTCWQSAATGARRDEGDVYRFEAQSTCTSPRRSAGIGRLFVATLDPQTMAACPYSASASHSPTSNWGPAASPHARLRPPSAPAKSSSAFQPPGPMTATAMSTTSAGLQVGSSSPSSALPRGRVAPDVDDTVQDPLFCPGHSEDADDETGEQRAVVRVAACPPRLEQYAKEKWRAEEEGGAAQPRASDNDSEQAVDQQPAAVEE